MKKDDNLNLEIATSQKPLLAMTENLEYMASSLRAPSEAEGRSNLDPLDFPQIFGNDHPVEIEIGCGTGRFLFACAEQSPETNFFGIDRVVKWMKRRMARTERENFKNLKFLKTEAWPWLARIPAGSIEVFHIYFPDPWPKRRHRKRRLVNESFLRELHARLKPQGLIEIATDDTDYFWEIQKAASATAALWDSRRESMGTRLRCAGIKTNYEMKFETRGKTNFYLELKK